MFLVHVFDKDFYVIVSRVISKAVWCNKYNQKNDSHHTVLLKDKIIPIIIMLIINAVPPWLKKGNGMPTTGKIPTTIAVLNAT